MKKSEQSDFFTNKAMKNKENVQEIERHVLNDILIENEINANIFTSMALLLLGALYLLSWLTTVLDVGTTDIGVSIMYFSVVTICSIGGVLGYLKSKKIKVTCALLEIAIISVSFAISIYGVQAFWCCMLFPIILSIRYFNSAFTVKVGIFSWLGLLLAMVIKTASGSQYVEMASVNIPDGTEIAVKGGLYNTLLQQGFVSSRDVIYNQFVMFIGYTLVFAAVIIIAYFLAKHGKKMIMKGAEMANEIQKAHLEIENAKTRVLISQLQPHFLYNSLSAIMAIDGNPPETIEALADFSKYLRGNLDSLKVEGLIHFSEEIAHIEHYIALEKLRFGDKLEFETELNATDFYVPALTIQMMVENSIKHGITKKIDGGKISLKSFEDDDGFYICVADDGVGFESNSFDLNNSEHVGLANSKTRIERLAGGSWKIDSMPGEGTIVNIFIPKEKENK